MIRHNNHNNTKNFNLKETTDRQHKVSTSVTLSDKEPLLIGLKSTLTVVQLIDK